MIKINNLISLICILFISILLAYASFIGRTSEAYLFPKIITSVMIILSLLSLILYFLDKNKTSANVDIKKLSVYLVSLILFILLGETSGFYFLAILLFSLNSYYYAENKKIIQNLLVTIIFMFFIYFLFSIMLKVQVPRFFLF
jgi:hypothetical protein